MTTEAAPTPIKPTVAPAPWHSDGQAVPMPQDDVTRFGVYVWSSVDDRLVSVVMGDTEGEAIGTAHLIVQLSRSVAAAEAAKAEGLPLPGEKIRIIEHQPEGTDLQIGEVVQVVADPDNGAELAVGEQAVWVHDAGSTQWALNPATRGIEWVVIPRVDTPES